MIHPFTFVAILAQAAPGKQAPGGPQQLIASFVPFILIFVIMYLLLIRPQQKKQQEHRELISRVKAGDRIMTTGGIHGTVTKVEEKTIMMEVAPGVEIEVARAAIGSILEASEATSAGSVQEASSGTQSGGSRSGGKTRGSGGSGRKRR